MTDFTPYGKTPRWSGMTTIITEKIDGTNCGVFVDTEKGEIYCQSRNRRIFPNQGNANDNFGFAAWAHANKDRLMRLGPGLHYGEWWGQGIGRGYGMTRRVWSLFDVHNSRYDKAIAEGIVSYGGDIRRVPVCVGSDPYEAFQWLLKHGSLACWPDGVEWHKPEGVVVNVILGGQNHRFKYTERNNQPKWQEKEQGDAQE